MELKELEKIEKEATTIRTNYIENYNTAESSLSAMIETLNQQIVKMLDDVQEQTLAELETKFQEQDGNFVHLQSCLEQVRAKLSRAQQDSGLFSAVQEETTCAEIAKEIETLERKFDALSAMANLEPRPSAHFDALMDGLEKAKANSLFYVRRLAVEPKGVTLQPEAVLRAHSKGEPILIAAKSLRGLNGEDCRYLERFLDASVVELETGNAVDVELKPIMEFEDDEERQTGVRISFLPPGRGLYEVSASLYGEPVANSPIKVKVAQKRQIVSLDRNGNGDSTSAA